MNYLKRKLGKKKIEMHNKCRKMFDLLAVRVLQAKSLMRYYFSAFNLAKM